MLKQIPNVLTVLRFLLIPIIIILAVKEDYILTIVLRNHQNLEILNILLIIRSLL